ncbi:MAG: GNAT family N-acetyltransferase [Deltaproteobacteria bacterium]|nr:GNAT family N-acetyltransferase [Deltaproteobacteria bacterium]
MRTRRLAPPDHSFVADLLRSDETFVEEEVQVAMELIDSAIRDPEGDYRALVCEDDAALVVGYACFGRTPMTQATCDLYWLATHRQARGRGVGTRLVLAMEAELLGAGMRTVRVETSKLEAYGAARAFYARLGYREVGRIPDFYRQGDDLIILAKRLDLPLSLGQVDSSRGAQRLA